MNRVLIIADDPLTRAGIASLLANQSRCTIVGQSAHQENLADALGVYRPDAIVWDWCDSIDLRDLTMPVVVLASDADAAREAWFAGARGVLLRQSSGEQIASAIESVVQGLAVFDPAIAPNLLPARDSSRNPTVEELTPREAQVLRLMAEGQSNKAIARTLGISEHTVKFHVNAVLGKLNAQSRTEAVVTATRLGLILL